MIGQNLVRTGACGCSQCCTLRHEEVVVPDAIIRSDRDSSSLSEGLKDKTYEFIMPVLSNYDYISQSEIVGDNTNETAEQTREGILTSIQHKEVSDTGGMSSHTLRNTTQDTHIQNYLSRPVKVLTFTWNESDTIGYKVDSAIWYDWMNRTSITNKIANYAFFRADLKIKVQISASPFYYGLLQMSYLPLTVFKSDTIYTDASNTHLIPRSQRPRILIDPSQGDTFEFTAPFIYPYNSLSIQSQADVLAMGTIRFDIYSALKSANGVTGSGITVNVYCWAENVELSGASTGYILQSDEYGEGPVSKPASWVADFASNFEKFPIIGTFATATRLGASAVSAIASLFGWTNVPVISNTEPYRPEPFPKLASTEISFPVEKLTVDPKNELSVDPRIVGLPDGTDEMIIANIAQRESYLCTSTWSTSDSVDTIKFSALVQPTWFDYATITGATITQSTPMGYVSRLFSQWRGDIIVTLRVIASKYHKGKLRISFDPSGTSNVGGNLTNTANTTNTVQTAIMDIGETREVEFTIPYSQKMQFLKLEDTIMTWSTSSSPSLTRVADQDNGYFSIRVQNALTAPVLTSSVDILIYVRAGNNIEFAMPDSIDITNRLSFYAPQSDEFSIQSQEYILVPINGKVTLGTVHQNIDNQYLIHYGENIKSLRQLMHRYTRLSLEYEPTSSAANTFQWIYKIVARLPMSPGYCPSGYGTANKQATGTAPYNFVQFTPVSYLSNAYLCYRGSVNYTFNVGSNIPAKNIIAERIAATTASLGSNSATVTNKSQMMRAGLTGDGARGMALTNQLTQAGVNVAFPMYGKERFYSTDPIRGNVPGSEDQEMLRLRIDLPFPSTTVSDNTIITTYYATGPDFGLYFFLNCPTLYAYNTYPAAP